MLMFLHVVQTLKSAGDINIGEGTIGAIAGPGATIGSASVVSQLHPSSEDEGVFSDPFTYGSF